MEFNYKGNNIFYINFKKKSVEKPVVSTNTSNLQMSSKRKAPRALDKKINVECNIMEKFRGSFNGELRIDNRSEVDDWEITGKKTSDFQWVSEVILSVSGNYFSLKPMNHNRNTDTSFIIKFGMNGNSLPSDVIFKYRLRE